MNNHYYDLSDNEARLAADGQLTEIRIPIEGLPQARSGEFKMIRRQMEWHVEWQLFAGTDFIQSVIPIFEIGDTIRGRDMPDEAIRHEWTVTGVDVNDGRVYSGSSPRELVRGGWEWVITLEAK